MTEKGWMFGTKDLNCDNATNKLRYQREWSAQNMAREPRRAARLRRTTAQDSEVHGISDTRVPRVLEKNGH